jgi:sugar-specific transcriptional regulator TrmB
MEKIIDFLYLIGFGKNEALVYETLLEIGTSSVHDISNRTKLYRSNIYDSLKKLLDKGLVFEINSPTKLFSARPIESLRDYLKFREAELDELIKSFEFKSKNNNIENKFKVSKGVFALREAINNLLNYNETIKVYGIPVKAPEIIGPMLKKFHNTRIRKKILMLHIYNALAIDRVNFLNKMKFTEARILPEKFDSNATTCVCGNKVVIFLWEKDITVIEMEDSEISKTYKNYFEILWKKAKVVRKKNKSLDYNF